VRERSLPARRLGRIAVGERQPRQRQRAHQQAEVTQRDVAVPAYEQQVDDDSAQPGRHQQPAEARRQQDDETSDDLDDADDVHRVGGVARNQVVELGRQVARPVVGQHVRELVDPEQDRRGRERDPQHGQGLHRGIPAQDVGLGYWKRPQCL